MLIRETVSLPRAKVRIHQERAYDFNEKTGLYLYKPVGEDEEAHNIITNTGRVQLHTQVYATGGILTNGFNWIGLTNDATVPAAADASLTAELTGFGLDRAQGVVTLPVGLGNQTTIVHTFTFTGGGSQGIQKTALFTQAGPPVAGVMNHEIAFTQRVLFTLDTISVTFTVTAG
jgi:hypothetical protein